MSLDLYSPYDETIFVDADAFFIRDTSDWWAEFNRTNGDVGVWGWNVSLDSPRRGALISNCAATKYGIDRYIGFNGGVYYFRRSENSNSIFEKARSLVKTYEEDEQHLFNGKKGDEPCMAIALILAGIYGVEDKEHNRMYLWNDGSPITINILKGVCSFQKHDFICNPAIIHWGTSSTKSPLYRREAIKLQLYELGIPQLINECVSELFFIVLMVKEKLSHLLKRINRMIYGNI